MTPTAVRGITIQLREFSWYYGILVPVRSTFYVIENTELTAGTLYLTSERDLRLIPGIESSRFDSSEYVLTSVEPGGTSLSRLPPQDEI